MLLYKAKFKARVESIVLTCHGYIRRKVFVT